MQEQNLDPYLISTSLTASGVWCVALHRSHCMNLRSSCVYADCDLVNGSSAHHDIIHLHRVAGPPALYSLYTLNKSVVFISLSVFPLFQ